MMLESGFPLEIKFLERNTIYSFLQERGGGTKKNNSLKIADRQGKGFSCPQMTRIENSEM